MNSDLSLSFNSRVKWRMRELFSLIRIAIVQMFGCILAKICELISSAIKVRYSGLMYNEVKFMVSIYIFVCLFVVFFIFMNENKLTS